MRTDCTGIYAITNISNGKKYIGHSINIRSRWNEHKRKLRLGIHGNSHLQASWNKFGENMFTFTILERLPFRLPKSECEKAETGWILKFNSHKREFGYNSILPGEKPSIGDDENIIIRKSTSYVCINILTNERTVLHSRKEVNESTGIPTNRVSDLAGYWNGMGKRKSLHGWIVVREEDYNPEIDYINYKKKKPSQGKTWRDYYNKEKHRKAPEDIIPREKRNLKRVPIIAVNILTGEEKYYNMIKECYVEFLPAKVQHCISAPFGKYQHRGYYFKRA